MLRIRNCALFESENVLKKLNNLGIRLLQDENSNESMKVTRLNRLRQTFATVYPMIICRTPDFVIKGRYSLTDVWFYVPESACFCCKVIYFKS